MLSTTTLVGHAADVPKTLRATGLPDGVALIRVRIAVNRGKDRAPDWWTIVGRVPAWLPAAVVRGTVLGVEGRASLEQWTAVDGTERAGLRLDANAIRVISGGVKARVDAEHVGPARNGAPAVGAGVSHDTWIAEALDDDHHGEADDALPF